jgi:protein-tyrosine phosphatase
VSSLDLLVARTQAYDGRRGECSDWTSITDLCDCISTEQGRKSNTATLVHCRVGVSRSATICIAEVMNELGLSFPRAYCFVRARRLNVIIQPHLRFS